MKKTGYLKPLTLALTLAASSMQIAAQPAAIPSKTVDYHWHSGSHSATGEVGRAAVNVAYRDTISVSGSPWIQLRFSDVNLGQASYIQVTSLADGASQRLDANELQHWGNQSAYFNGDAVEIELYVASGDSDVGVAVNEVVAGEKAANTRSLCAADDRISSTEPRVARIDPIGCTGWIAENGKILTAGHCLAGGNSNQILSFNPPQSLPDGTVQFPGPEDQYAIDQSSFQFNSGGVGNDWGIFQVFNNSVTGLQPIQAQGAFTVVRDLGPANIRISGFGLDSGTSNQTNQTNVGPNAGSSGTTMRYITDTMGGNSGSPVIDNQTGRSVGIHTHGGCTSTGTDNNSGTSFFNTELWDAFNARTEFASGTAVGDQATVNGFRSIGLGKTLTSPIVVMGPPSFNGGNPTSMRVRAVDSFNFQYQIEEWDYLDGTHISENIGYLAIEAGRGTLGSLDVEAGAVNINQNWTTVTFSSAISPTPVVVAQTVTRNGGQAVTTRIRNVSSTGFEVRLQEEEANDGNHVIETVHWIALETGSSIENGVPIAAGRTDDAITNSFANVDFGTSISDPVLLADMQTFDGPDTATLRHRNLTSSGVEIKVEEELSGDDEINHTTEVVGWIVFGNN